MQTRFENISAKPGIYEIFNTYNQKRYYGESQNVLLRIGQHIINLHKKPSTKNLSKHVNLGLYDDWQKFGAKAFVFRGLVYEQGMEIESIRKKKENDFIRANGAKAYNELGNKQEKYLQAFQARQKGEEPTVNQESLKAKYNQYSKEYVKNLAIPQESPLKSQTEAPLKLNEISSSIGPTKQFIENQGPTKQLTKNQGPTKQSNENEYPIKKSLSERGQAGGQASAKVLSVKTVVDGKEYDSGRAAVRQLAKEGINISVSDISLRARDPRFPNYGFIDKNGNFTKESQKKPKRYEIEGEVYNNLGEVLAVHPIKDHTVLKRTKSSNDSYDRWKVLSD